MVDFKNNFDDSCFMSYEQAPATRILATHCAACRRPLLDAKSVEIGIGPDCRKRLGFDLEVAPEARTRANKLVYQIALEQEGKSTLEAAAELRGLGFDKLAARIIERLAKVVIEETNGELAVYAPFVETACGDWRGIPGRRWDGEAKCNRMPSNQRRALFGLLKKHYPGALATGPKGAFVVGEV